MFGIILDVLAALLRAWCFAPMGVSLARLRTKKIFITHILHAYVLMIYYNNLYICSDAYLEKTLERFSTT